MQPPYQAGFQQYLSQQPARPQVPACCSMLCQAGRVAVVSCRLCAACALQCVVPRRQSCG